MPEPINDLIEISRFYGSKKEFVIAGGGNTSYKDEERIYIKASGIFLATIDEEGFVVLDRKKYMPFWKWNTMKIPRFGKIKSRIIY